MRQDSSVSKMTGYGMCDQNSVLSRDGDFSLYDCFHTSSGAYEVSYLMGTRVLSPEARQLGCVAEHSVPSNARINAQSFISTPHVSSWCGT